MDTRKDEVLVEYARKLKELNFLWSNPLRPFPTSGDSATINSGESSRNIDNSDIESVNPIVLKDLRRLRRDLTANSQKYLHSPDVEDETRKRPVKDAQEPAKKSQKTSASDFPSRLMPVSGGSRDKKAVSKNLQSQIASLEQETNEFLNKRISDVDVVSLPENLPTEVHNVLSLAELYYLTQTLPLIKLLPGTHKTLMTENFELAILEGKVAVLFSRIEELKRLKKWSLRQPIRYYDPFVYAKRNKKAKLFTWDNVLQEGKWMAADFKESTKYKKLCCVTMAQAVQDYWTYGKVVCVSTKPIKHLPEISKTAEHRTRSSLVDNMDIDLTGISVSAESTQPIDLAVKDEGMITSTEVIEDEDEEPETIDISKLLERPNPGDEIKPHELPEYLPQDLANLGVNVKNRGPFKAHVNLHELKKIDLSIIRNLPKFTAFDETDNHKPIPTGETAIVPVSRMLYPMEDDEEWHKIVLRDSRKLSKSSTPATGLPEYQKGLFGVQSHRRLNFLRPPKPPLVKNIEYRSPTIWLPQDDKYLIHYVAEYCFNWDLIAENLHSNASTLKRYESNIERRTPWQCFERYIQLNEKFQFSDMKGMNAYLAQQWLEQAHKAQLTTKRRISPLGVGNESIQRGHRRLRWASMFDAMRKTMRKRETAAAKANTRKNTNLPDITGSSSTSTSSSVANNGSGAVKRASDKIPTPSELSKLKFDRDKTIQEAFLHQQATRSKMIAAVTQQKHLAEVPHPSLLSPGMGGPTDMTGTGVTGPTQRRVSQAPARAPGSVLSSPSLQRPQAVRPNSQQLGGGTALLNGVQLQPNKQAIGNFKRPTTPNGTPLTVEQIQRLLQIQKQRRLIQAQQQQQQQSGVSGILSTAGNSMAASPNPLARKPMPSGSAQVPASQSLSANGLAGAGMGGSQSAGAVGSGPLAKRGAVPTRGRMQFPPAQVSAIINSIQQKNPNLTKDQVTKLAASYLANLQQQQQNKLELQSGRPATAGESSTSTQQSLQARQAQLSRQRLAAAQNSAGLATKEADAQTLSKMQYEERKRLMMQQGGSQYGQSSTGSAGSSGSAGSTGVGTKLASTQPLKGGAKAPAKTPRSQGDN